VIGIAGPSGSGKTTLAHKVAAQLNDAPVLSLDCYYREQNSVPLELRRRVNYDEPAALDHELLVAQLKQFSRGIDVAVPVYDFARHNRASEVMLLRAADFLIVEGIFALYWKEVRDLMGTKIFVTASDPVCFTRRLDRDVKERGRTPESVVDMYEHNVRPMAERYVLPTQAFADIVVSGTDLLDHSSGLVLGHAAVNSAAAAESGRRYNSARA
jgi:uridine kinase